MKVKEKRIIGRVLYIFALTCFTGALMTIGNILGTDASYPVPLEPGKTADSETEDIPSPSVAMPDDAYTPVGDPFYSAVADYYAFIHTPAGYTLATTGLTQTTPQADGTLLHQVLSPARRDFAFVAARDFTEGSADTVCQAYRLFSDAMYHLISTEPDQYGPCRIGPAYPFILFDHQDVQIPTVPFAHFGGNKITFQCQGHHFTQFPRNDVGSHADDAFCAH